jgi:hypothetical protein
MGTEIWRDVTVFRWRADRSLSNILGSGLVGRYCGGFNGCDCPGGISYMDW